MRASRCEAKDYIALVDEVAAAAGGPAVRRPIRPQRRAMVQRRAARRDRGGVAPNAAAESTCTCWRRAIRAHGRTHSPGGVVKHLDALGLLSPRLTLAHCVWARPDELELLAERGVTIAVNTSSNLHLRSGIAPVPLMFEAGCRVALGIDGSALDDDDDALRELRLWHLLHVGKGFEIAVSREQMLRAAFANGRFSVTNASDGGAIRAGEPADILLLDWAAIDDDSCVRISIRWTWC